LEEDYKLGNLKHKQGNTHVVSSWKRLTNWVI